MSRVRTVSGTGPASVAPRTPMSVVTLGLPRPRGRPRRSPAADTEISYARARAAALSTARPGRDTGRLGQGGAVTGYALGTRASRSGRARIDRKQGYIRI